jgi:sn-2 palmitoyl-lipid 9-desaturase
MSSNSLQTPHQPVTQPPLSWITIAYFAFFHLVAILAAPFFFSWSAVAVAVCLNWLFGSVGICLGYHRLLTHRSFAVPKPVEKVITTIACFALQGGPIFWVSAHRRHHLHTEDLQKDPYSAARGFFWSHMGWLLRPESDTWNYETYRKFAPDIDRDPYYRWLDANFVWLQIPLGLCLYLWGGWSFVVYGLFVRNVIEWHGTWLINSACHLWGYRTYECQDHSTNLWWAALLTYGEGWHNNHHAFPNSAQTGIRWWEIDPTWGLIRSLQFLGIATRVQLPTE